MRVLNCARRDAKRSFIIPCFDRIPQRSHDVGNRAYVAGDVGTVFLLPWPLDRLRGGQV